MIRPASKDMDYLAAALHGRRSRMVEAGRLDSLLSLKTFSDMGHQLALAPPCQTATDIQHRLVLNLATEIPLLTQHLTGVESNWVAWAGIQFHLANIKLLIRTILSNHPPATILMYWLDFPGSIPLDTAKAIAATSLDTLVDRLLKKPLGQSLKAAVATYHDPPHPFLIEAALDRDYFQELLDRTNRLSGDDLINIHAMVTHEAECFLRLLALRGRFHYNLPPSLLAPLHIKGTAISEKRFIAMLNASTANTDIPSLETLAWKRYVRLANTAFRRSHTGFGVVAGYIGLRRMEVANLIIVSEGIRAGLPRDAIRARLFFNTIPEPTHV